MRSARVVLVLGAAATAMVTLADPVGADCSFPQVELDRHVAAAGGPVNVRGERWGTECFDTGPPPKGVGPLGPAATQIEVVLVESDRERVLARGAADADYRFDVEVVVPADAAVGDAQVIARSEDVFRVMNVDPTLRVTAPTGATAASAEPVTFGPDGDAGSSGPRRRGVWLVAAAAVVVVGGAAAAGRFRRASPGRRRS